MVLLDDIAEHRIAIEARRNSTWGGSQWLPPRQLVGDNSLAARLAKTEARVLQNMATIAALSDERAAIAKERDELRAALDEKLAAEIKAKEPAEPPAAAPIAETPAT